MKDTLPTWWTTCHYYEVKISVFLLDDEFSCGYTFKKEIIWFIIILCNYLATVSNQQQNEKIKNSLFFPIIYNTNYEIPELLKRVDCRSEI